MANLIVLTSFNGTLGANPEASLFEDANGDLFGTTFNGGADGFGTVFELAKNASGYAGAPTILASFDGTTAGNSLANLIADADGDLFGTTYAGGADGGTVFEIAKTTTGYASALDVLGTAPNPEAGLIADANGDLFGTANYSDLTTGAIDGEVFEFAKTANGYASTPTVLARFDATDGAFPEADLILDSKGDLFGTTTYGGANSADGTVFEISKTAAGYASTPTTLASFDGTDGSVVQGGLVADANGDLFGTTQGGGADGDGTVFELAKNAEGYAATPNVLLSFDLTDGADPACSLILDANGDLFGTTEGGGADGDGTVFELAKTASAPTILFTFDGADGADPAAGLIVDAKGDLFGTTSAGGADGKGEAFEITNSGYVVGVLTVSGVYAATGWDAAQVSVSINADGSVGFDSPNGLENLIGVTAIDLADATIAVNGNVLTQSNANGSTEVSRFNITGQSYTTIVRSFDASGDLSAVEHEGLTGSLYDADTTLYSGPGSTGNIVSGNDLFYANQASGLTEVDLDGSQNLIRALYAYVTTAPGTQKGFEADYVAGQLADGVATYLAPAGATYSTYEVEYDNNYQYVGAVYNFTYTGQTYDRAQYSYTAGAQPKLTEATFSGYTGSGGPNVASFFYDNTGALAASQYAYAGVTGQLYTSDTLLYNSSNVLIAAEYGGYTSKPFSSQTTFYNASGAAAQIVRDFNSVASAGSINGQAYNAYEKILNPSFVLQATSYHLDNGGNVYVGVASNVSSPSFGGTGVTANKAELSDTLTGGDWTITGGGTGETFNFAAFFNRAEITDYGAAFGGATDIVSVSTLDFANWQTMLGDAAPSGGGANTTFTSTTTGDKLTLDGVTVAQLTALTTQQANADFLFHS